MIPPEVGLCVVYNKEVPADKETSTIKNNKSNLKQFCITEVNKLVGIQCANDTENMLCKYVNKKITKEELDKDCANKSGSDKKECDYVKMFY